MRSTKAGELIVSESGEAVLYGFNDSDKGW